MSRSTTLSRPEPAEVCEAAEWPIRPCAEPVWPELVGYWRPESDPHGPVAFVFDGCTVIREQESWTAGGCPGVVPPPRSGWYRVPIAACGDELRAVTIYDFMPLVATRDTHGFLGRDASGTPFRFVRVQSRDDLDPSDPRLVCFADMTSFLACAVASSGCD